MKRKAWSGWTVRNVVRRRFVDGLNNGRSSPDSEEGQGALSDLLVVFCFFLAENYMI